MQKPTTKKYSMNVYIETLGCPKNYCDSENAAGILVQNGYQVVNSLSDAHIIIVNTCGFINDAKEESIDKIFEMAEYAKDEKLLVVSGCLSERYKDEFCKAMPEADLIIGVNEYSVLPQLLSNLKKEEQLSCFNGCPTGYSGKEPRISLSNTYSSYLKIAEGCNNICSYCIIPKIRGGYRSKKIETILSEAEELVEKGCRELILIAQDVTAYGIDIYGEYCLHELLEKLCEIPKLHWIRIMYCYEERITDKLIEVMSLNTKICKYIDIPIQHASDKILSAMNRRSTRSTIEKTVKKLRSAMPDIHIRTTLISGFPGETDEDARILEEFVEDMRFERLGVFVYSKEDGTKAALMKSQVPDAKKHERKDRLMRSQHQISLEKNLEKVGNTYEVLVEEIGNRVYVGRTEYDAPEIDNSVSFTSKRRLKIGDLARVVIDEALNYDLIGHSAED
jgi:ribosomal protein S12 methylthiotransferase